MPKFLVTWCLVKGMEDTIEADTAEEAIKLMKEEPDEGRELDREIENIDCCKVGD